MTGSPHPVPSDGVSPDLLAELQAGLLDDATAAGLRQRVRTDADAAAMLAALDRVRRDVAALGDDAASAPAVPPGVSERLIAALRTADGPGRDTHAPTPRRGWRTFGAIAGGGAAVLAVAVGTAALTRAPEPARSAPTSIGQLTEARAELSLSEPQILGLLSDRPDLGPLADPQRRTQCLAALGYPSGVRVLGARPLAVDGRPGVLVLLPADTPDAIVGLVVAPDCASGHAALLADTVVNRPVKRS